MVTTFVIMLIAAAPHMKMLAATNSAGIAEIAGLVCFGGAIYGFATGWSSCAADYNVNQPENTSPSRVFWLTFLGVFVPCVLLEIFGVALTSVGAWAAAFAGGDVGSLLSAAVSPLGSIATLVLVLLVLSVIAINV